MGSGVDTGSDGSARAGADVDDSQTLSGGAALLILTTMVAVGGQGAYAGASRLVTGALLGAAAVAGFVARHGWPGVRAVSRKARTRTGVRDAVAPELRPVVACLIALGAWAIGRGWLAGNPGDGLGTAALVAGVAVVLLLCHRAVPTDRAAVRAAVLVIGVVAALSGWVGVVWRIEPLALPSSGMWRAAGTLTYENALAGVVVPLAVMAIAHVRGSDGCGDRQAMVMSAMACLLLTGAGASMSRGGVLALLVGLVALSVAFGIRATLRTAAGPVIGALIALSGLLPSLGVGTQPQPFIALIALAVGVAIAAWSARDRPRGAAAVAVAGAAIALVCAGVAIAAAPSVWEAVSRRASLVSPHRVSQHAAALAVIADHPVVGVGPGRGAVSWSDADGNTLVARYVHDEYVQVTVELGLVGALLLAGVFAFGARAVRYGRSSTAAVPWMGSVAALSALSVHSAVDFLWHIPAIPFVAAILTGAATRYESSDRHTGHRTVRKELA